MVAYWTENQSEQMAIAVIASFAAVFLVFFAGVLRGYLRDAEGGSGALSSITFAGAIIAATGMLAITTVEYAAAQSAGDVPAQVTQTLSALQANTFLGVSAGFGIFGVAAGMAILRTGAMSRRMGWVSAVGGLLWLSPGQFVAIFLTIGFVVVASVQLYRRHLRPQPVVAHPRTAH